MGKKDYGWVTSRLAVGGEITSLYDVRRMEADGITHVLNVRTSQDEVEWVQKVGLQYASNPTSDDYAENKPPEWFKSSCEIIRAAMSNPSSRVLVHCQTGRNRSPCTVYFYLRTIGLDKDTCLDLVTDGRPEADGEMAYLKDAESALKELGYKD